MPSSATLSPIGNFMLAQVPVSLRVGPPNPARGGKPLFRSQFHRRRDGADGLSQDHDGPGRLFRQHVPAGKPAERDLAAASWLSLSFYNQFEWRPSRQFGDGSFLSYLDYVGTGSARLFLTPSRYLVLNPGSRAVERTIWLYLARQRRGHGSGTLCLALPRQGSRSPLWRPIPLWRARPARSAIIAWSILPASISIGASFSTDMGRQYSRRRDFGAREHATRQL